MTSIKAPSRTRGSGSPLRNGASPRTQSGGVSSVEPGEAVESDKPYLLRHAVNEPLVHRMVRPNVTNVNS
jgi:hypothetical protein